MKMEHNEGLSYNNDDCVYIVSVNGDSSEPYLDNKNLQLAKGN